MSSAKVENAYRYTGSGIKGLLLTLRRIKDEFIEQESQRLAQTGFYKNEARREICIDLSGRECTVLAFVYFVAEQIYVQFVNTPAELVQRHGKILSNWSFEFGKKHKGVSDAEWRERERFWDRVFRSHANAFNISLQFHFFDAHEIAARIIELREKGGNNG